MFKFTHSVCYLTYFSQNLVGVSDIYSFRPFVFTHSGFRAFTCSGWMYEFACSKILSSFPGLCIPTHSWEHSAQARASVIIPENLPNQGIHLLTRSVVHSFICSEFHLLTCSGFLFHPFRDSFFHLFRDSFIHPFRVSSI